MNKQPDLISNDKAIGIAEGRGWKDPGPIHQRLIDLARRGSLRPWGYKGNSAELRLIDPLVWQDHGLDMSNGQLVIPDKIFAPDYAEQVWRDVHWDRQEIEAAFPDPDESGEERCGGWLMQEMRENPENPPKPKTAYADEAKQRFAVSRRAFDRIWAAAIKETGAKWNRKGRRPRSEKS